MIEGFALPTVRVWKVYHKTDFRMGSYFFNPKPVLSDGLFRNKRALLFGMPGAFHYTKGACEALPQIENLYDDFLETGIDEVYVTSVNDPWTIKEWFKINGVTKPVPFADGNGDFARKIGMLNDFTSVGAGYRSWRYAMVVNNGVVEWLLQEHFGLDKTTIDPYENVRPEYVLQHLITDKIQKDFAREEAEKKKAMEKQSLLLLNDDF